MKSRVSATAAERARLVLCDRSRGPAFYMEIDTGIGLEEGVIDTFLQISRVALIDTS